MQDVCPPFCFGITRGRNLARCCRLLLSGCCRCVFLLYPTRQAHKPEKTEHKRDRRPSNTTKHCSHSQNTTSPVPFFGRSSRTRSRISMSHFPLLLHPFRSPLGIVIPGSRGRIPHLLPHPLIMPSQQHFFAKCKNLYSLTTAEVLTASGHIRSQIALHARQSIATLSERTRFSGTEGSNELDGVADASCAFGAWISLLSWRPQPYKRLPNK